MITVRRFGFVLLGAALLVGTLGQLASAQSRRGGSNWSLHSRGFGYGEGTRYHNRSINVPSYGYGGYGGYGYGGYGGGWGGYPYYPPYSVGYGGAAVYFPYGTPVSPYYGYTGYPYDPSINYNTWQYNNYQPPLHPNLQEYQAQQEFLKNNDPSLQPSKPMLPSSQHNRDEAANLVAQGKALMGLQQFQRSLAKFKLAIQNAPELPEPYFCMAANYLAINNGDKAIEMIQRGLTQDPYWPFSNPTLSQFYGAENIALVEQIKTRVVEWTHDNVRDADRLFLLGVVLIFEQDFANSRTLLQTAQAVNFNQANPQIATLIQSIDSVSPVGQAAGNPVQSQVLVPNSQIPNAASQAVVPQNMNLGPVGKFPDATGTSATTNTTPVPPTPFVPVPSKPSTVPAPIPFSEGTSPPADSPTPDSLIPPLPITSDNG